MLTIGSRTISVNGVNQEIDVAPQIVSDRTLVSTRFVAEAMGKKVDWIPESRMVMIATAGNQMPAGQNLTPTPKPINASDYERKVIELVNAERVSCGIQPLIWDNDVAIAAKAHSEDMAKNNFLGHVGSGGSSVRNRLARVGITNPGMTAKNVGRGHTTPESQVNSWLNSTGHRSKSLFRVFLSLYLRDDFSPFFVDWPQAQWCCIKAKRR